jgi:hypothetical protein
MIGCVPTDTSAAWAALAERQAGVVARSQALALGLSPRQVDWLVASGRWAHALPGVYAVHTGPRSDAARVWAALLRSGDGAVAGGRTALWLAGAVDQAPSVVEVCVPHRRRVLAPQEVEVTRCVRRVERAHHLPRARRNACEPVAGRSVYRDLRYDRWGVVVELDGLQAHPAERRHRDRRRDNEVVLSGRAPLRFGWPDVVAAPCDVAAQVAQLLRRRGWAGRLTQCGAACTALRAAGGDDRHVRVS